MITPHPVDKHVGNKLRIIRSFSGVSQEKVAQTLGLTFQQIQKYERGLNRISASKLWEISKVFNVKPQFFFEGFERDFTYQPANEDSVAFLSVAENVDSADDGVQESDLLDLLTSSDSIELLKAFSAVKDPSKRKAIIDMILLMAK